uniref:Dehydrogenase/reductase SDR family member 13-like n=1 Tax=Phallusia mammillata TaxID=59560 RepID=A0A6F9DBQ7_9ASCI|nr:dehydrogenase/reductase SDR family member 13-like [Phallusia mammillata]
MLSKKQVLIVFLSLFVYYWIKYVKQGPVYISDKRLDGKTVLITGGNVGIGKAAAIEFAKLGAKVVIASRNKTKSLKAAKEIADASENRNVFSMQLDLEKFDSIKSFAEEFHKKEENLHYLINNAGVLGINGITDYGFHRVFAINHFGPFLLTNLLMKKMKETSKKSPVRIINVSSGAYRFGPLDFDLLHNEADGLVSGYVMYGQSKLANIYFTSELNNRLIELDITTYSLHPGVIQSELGTDVMFSSPPMSIIRQVANYLVLKDAYYGAQTTMYCSLDDNIIQLSGQYFHNCKHEELRELAKDQETSRKLWKLSEKVTQKYLTDNW